MDPPGLVVPGLCLREAERRDATERTSCPLGFHLAVLPHRLRLRAYWKHLSGKASQLHWKGVTAIQGDIRVLVDIDNLFKDLPALCPLRQPCRV